MQLLNEPLNIKLETRDCIILSETRRRRCRAWRS